MWIVLLFEVTPFEESVSTILLQIVATPLLSYGISVQSDHKMS